LAFMAFNLRRAVSILGAKKLVEAINSAASSSENLCASFKRSVIAFFELFLKVAKLA
jgi:hypothetical protein